MDQLWRLIRSSIDDGLLAAEVCDPHPRGRVGATGFTAAITFRFPGRSSRSSPGVASRVVRNLFPTPPFSGQLQIEEDAHELGSCQRKLEADEGQDQGAVG